MTEQEPLFPTSETERRALQEELVEALDQETRIQEAVKLETAKARGELAKARKRVQAITTVLRQSGPRRTPHRDDG